MYTPRHVRPADEARVRRVIDPPGTPRHLCEMVGWSATTQLALVAVIVAVATTVALLLRSRRLLHRRFAAFAISVALYYLTAIITSVIGMQEASALMAGVRILTGTGVLISSTIFFDAILGDAGITARTRSDLLVLATTVLIVLSGLVLFDVFDQVFRIGAQAVSAAIIITILGLRAVQVLRKTREVKSVSDRVRLQYLAAGGLIAVFGFSLDLLALQGLWIPPLGGLLIAVYLYFISQALMASRLLDLQELLGRALVFAVLSLILATVYGLLVVWVGESAGLFLFNTLIASIIILILFEPLKAYLEGIATRVLLRERLAFSRAMIRCARRIATLIEPEAAVAAVLDEVYEQKGATAVSIYLFDQAGLRLVRQGFRGTEGQLDLSAKEHPALFTQLLENKNPILRDNLEAELEKDIDELAAHPGDDEAPVRARVLAALSLLEADLALPIRAEEQTVGLFCLRDDRLAEAYAKEEIAALSRVADQLAINIENSRLFDTLKEKDRLATLGEMSAGLAHEIRNPLAAIKGAAQLLDPAQLEGEDGELLQVIVDEVDRLNAVVSQFLDYARPHRGTFSPLSVNDAVMRTVQLMTHDLPDTVQVETDLTEDLPDVSGDAEQLQQVLINLILNAKEAMEEKGSIHISTSLERRGYGAHNRQVVMRVKDSGPGLSEQAKRGLFIPFFTTKHHGTGLGLALCQRIVKNHGGSIDAYGALGEGATFVLRLPALPKKKPKPNQDDSTTSAPSTEDANQAEKSPAPGA